ncbi:MAG: hypothetical protein U9P79_04175 [Candidatus Cloacimonadota bacterium]|nr:hypothetical protein [Candidatus Cloacimonadota bacterium]
MSGTQMLLVLLATILFSTIFISTYNNMFNMVELAYQESFIFQGLKLADKYFQKIEAETLGEIYTFSEMNSIYSNLSDTTLINGIVFHHNIQANYCDSIGNDVTPTSSYQRFDISMWAIPTSNDTIYIGTSTDPLSLLITEMEF